MASPFTIVANATAVFDLPAAGTITDSLGNVRPAIETLSISLFLSANPEQQQSDLPGVDPTTTVLSGYAVDPMTFDSRIMRGTEGSLTWNGRSAAFIVDGVRERYGDTGFIATTLAAQRGDDIRLTIKRQS